MHHIDNAKGLSTEGSFASDVALWIVPIPIALAVLISYALAPMMSWLERHREPRLAVSSASLFELHRQTESPVWFDLDG